MGLKFRRDLHDDTYSNGSLWNLHPILHIRVFPARNVLITTRMWVQHNHDWWVLNDGSQAVPNGMILISFIISPGFVGKPISPMNAACKRFQTNTLTGVSCGYPNVQVDPSKPQNPLPFPGCSGWCFLSTHDPPPHTTIINHLFYAPKGAGFLSLQCLCWIDFMCLFSSHLAGSFKILSFRILSFRIRDDSTSWPCSF